MNSIQTWLGVKDGYTTVTLIGKEELADWRVSGSAFYADLKGKLYPFIVYALEKGNLLKHLDEIKRVEIKVKDAHSRLWIFLQEPEPPIELQQQSEEGQEEEDQKQEEQENNVTPQSTPKTHNQKNPKRGKGRSNKDSIKRIFGMEDNVIKPDTPDMEIGIVRQYKVKQPHKGLEVLQVIALPKSSRVEILNSILGEITPNGTVKIGEKEMSIEKFNNVIAPKLYEK